MWGLSELCDAAVQDFDKLFAYSALRINYIFTGNDSPVVAVGDVEQWEPNITTLVDFSLKWEGSIADGVERPTDERREGCVTGLCEGAGYRNSGIYRPTVTCHMRGNGARRFGPVCEKALETVILHQTGR